MYGGISMLKASQDLRFVLNAALIHTEFFPCQIAFVVYVHLMPIKNNVCYFEVMTVIFVSLRCSACPPIRLSIRLSISLLFLMQIAGNDVRNMSSETLEILTNTEVIAVNQDPMGKPGIRVYQSADKTAEVWSRQLHDGTYAVVLFNRSVHLLYEQGSERNFSGDCRTLPLLSLMIVHAVLNVHVSSSLVLLREHQEALKQMFGHIAANDILHVPLCMCICLHRYLFAHVIIFVFTWSVCCVETTLMSRVSLCNGPTLAYQMTSLRCYVTSGYTRSWEYIPATTRHQSQCTVL